MRIDRIKFITELTKKDLTQKKIADIAGVARTTVNSIKAGKSCSETTGRKIAEALGVDIAELLEEPPVSNG